MSNKRSFERIEQITNKLRDSFENSPYEEAVKEDIGDAVVKDSLLLSVVIPARNEFPNIVHTIYSIWHCWEADGYAPQDIEIIIVDNCSRNWEDEKYDWSKPGDRGTVTYLMPRGAYNDKRIRVLYDPIPGNHSARNKGAAIARGKYVFFSDAHMAYKPGSFKAALKACEESGGIVHFGINWMGAYAKDHEDSRTGMQYTIKLGEEWKGTWNPYRPWSDKWFYIPAQGHCSVLVNRKQFLDFRGYPPVHRTYGGGEFYMNMKWWMFGSCVVAEPRAIGYHLASGRGYTYTHDDYIHNVLNCAYAIGADDWRERTYLNYLRRGKKDILDRMMRNGEKEMASDRAFIASRKVKTFNDLLVERPWDEKNMERGGAKNSSMLIFHYSWLDLVDKGGGGAPPAPHVRKLYDESPLQQELARFITTKLHDHVYKWQNYESKEEEGETV